MGDPRLNRFWKWVTTPTLLHGVALGAAIVMLLILVWQLTLFEHILTFLIFIALFFIAIILGVYAFGKRSQNSEEKTSVAVSELFKRLSIITADGDQSHRETALKELKADADALGKVVVGATARFFALAKLFGLLGVIVSFAIFVATHRQVEKIEEQNTLIQLQALSTHQQVSITMKNQISQVAQLKSLATELLTVFEDQGYSVNSFMSMCEGANEKLEDAILDFDEVNMLAKNIDRNCLISIAKFLKERANDLESNRLIGLQVSGGILASGSFSRDLTEQFMTQFSTTCLTDSNRLAVIGRKWGALNRLEETTVNFIDLENRSLMREFQELSPPKTDDPLWQGVNAFLETIDKDADTVVDFAFEVSAVYDDVNEYLEEQKVACGQRERALFKTLNTIDAKYTKMLSEMEPEKSTGMEL